MDPTKENTKDNVDVKSDNDTMSIPKNTIDTTGVPDTSDTIDIPDVPSPSTPVGAVDIESLMDPKTPDIPEASGSSAPVMPEMPSTPDMDGEKPSSIEDDPNITIDSTKEPKDDPEDHEVLDVEPAPPAPGSIGSVKSGPVKESEPTKISVETGPMTAIPDDSTHDQQAAELQSEVESQKEPKLTDMPKTTAEELVMEAANTPPAVAEDPEPTITVQQPKQSHRTTMILVIILAIILLGACIAGIVFLMQGNTQSNKTANQPTITTTSTSELVCVADITAAQTEALQVPVNKAQNIKKFSYNNNSLTDMTDTTRYTFENTDVAKEKLETLKTSYQNLYTAASLTQDPFESDFVISDVTITVTHNANADQLNTKNASIVGLNSNSSSTSAELATDLSTLKSRLEEAGYICAAAENTTAAK